MTKETKKNQQALNLEKATPLTHRHKSKMSSTRKNIGPYTRAVIQNNKLKHKRIQIILAASSDLTPNSQHINNANLQFAELIGRQIARDTSQSHPFNHKTNPTP